MGAERWNFLLLYYALILMCESLFVIQDALPQVWGSLLCVAINMG